MPKEQAIYKTDFTFETKEDALNRSESSCTTKDSKCMESIIKKLPMKF
jgi:hypothetical protein